MKMVYTRPTWDHSDIHVIAVRMRRFIGSSLWVLVLCSVAIPLLPHSNAATWESASGSIQRVGSLRLGLPFLDHVEDDPLWTLPSERKKNDTQYWLSSLDGWTSDRMRPSIFILGEQKCGTTSMFRWLAQHPLFISPRKKEICTLWDDADDRTTWSKYMKKFPPTRQENTRWSTAILHELQELEPPISRNEILPNLRTGEGCTHYIVSDCASKRVAEWFRTAARGAVLVRDPIRRLRSAVIHYAYRHYDRTRRQLLAGNVPDDVFVPSSSERNYSALADALASMAVRDGEKGASNFHFERGLYASNIQRLVDNGWPAEELLVVVSEAFLTDPIRTMNEMESFFDLPHKKRYTLKKQNSYTIHYELSDDIVDRLRALYADEVDRLSQMIGADLRKVWKSFSQNYE